MDKIIRILVVDDHPILRKGLQLVIKTQKDMEVVGEAGSVSEAIQLLRELNPDLIILDLSLPDRSGIEFIREIKTHCAGVRILVLTIHDDETYIKKVFTDGGNGYLLKKAVDAELLLAVRAVNRGEMFLDSSLTRSFIQGMMGDASIEKGDEKSRDKLSTRQREILMMIAQGYTDRQIAEKLYISIKTVESHKARIKEKLNVIQRSDLVKYAQKMLKA